MAEWTLAAAMWNLSWGLSLSLLSPSARPVRRWRSATCAISAYNGRWFRNGDDKVTDAYVVLWLAVLVAVLFVAYLIFTDVRNRVRSRKMGQMYSPPGNRRFLLIFFVLIVLGVGPYWLLKKLGYVSKDECGVWSGFRNTPHNSCETVISKPGVDGQIRLPNWNMPARWWACACVFPPTYSVDRRVGLFGRDRRAVFRSAYGAANAVESASTCAPLQNGLPALNCIVVSQQTGTPGHGVVVRKNKSWSDEARDSFNEDWFRYRVPSTGTLRQIWEQLDEDAA
jgi:hypothetical protein